MRGGERQLLYLARYLQSQGHENIVVCRRGSRLAAEAYQLNLKTLFLPFLGEWDPISASLLRYSAWRSKYPAIFHAHTAHAASLAFLASRLNGPRRVVHRRVDFRLHRGLSRRIKYDTADAVVAVSHAIKKLLVRDGVPESEIRVVNDCIPMSDKEVQMAGSAGRFCPAIPEERRQLRDRLGLEWKVPPNAVWIGNIAAMVPHKDQANLLKAMTVVRSHVAEAHLFLIGDGPLRRNLENLTRQLGLTPRVHFVGQQADTIPWFQALDIFVLPSWGEGMGSVLLEALACGLPIVATTAGGISEVIGKSPGNVLVPPRDSESLGHAIIEVVRHRTDPKKPPPDENSILARFGLTRCGEALEEIYNSVATR